MIILANALLFFLVTIVFFPASFESLVSTLLCFIILLVICAFYSQSYRKIFILITLGLGLSIPLGVPPLLKYQKAHDALPKTDNFKLRIQTIYEETKTLEAEIINKNSVLDGFIVRIYNIHDIDTILINGTYEAKLTIQPNHVKSLFNKFNQRLHHLAKHRIGNANLKSPLVLIEAPSKLTQARLYLSDYFDHHNFKNAPLMSALTVGLTHHLSQDQWQLLRQTGTIHLVSISGLHLTFIALWCFLILKTLFGLFMAQKPAPYQLAAICSLVIAISYAFLAGMSLPTQRALIMFSILMLALIIRYPILSLQSLATALLIVLITTPLAVVTIGFWLSFSSVLILMLLNQYRFSFFISLLLTQLIISTLAIPIVGSFFNEISLISPIANLFAIPWTTIIVLPLLLLGSITLPISPNLAYPLFELSNSALTQLVKFLNVINHIPYSHIDVPYTPLLVAIAMTIFAIILLTKVQWKIKAYSSIGIIILIGYIERTVNEEYLLVFPVGEGLSVLLKTKDITLLFDTGTSYNGIDSASTTIIPSLKNSKIQYLDYVILSHKNQHHIGGTQSIMEAFPNASLVTHQSLHKKYPNSIDCDYFTFQNNNISIEPMKTDKSCAFNLNINAHHLWLIANLTNIEWLQLLKNNVKPHISLMPNKGRTKGFRLSAHWEDVILIGSTKKIHESYQHHHIHNAYNGAIKIILSDPKLNITSISDRTIFWWMTNY